MSVSAIRAEPPVTLTSKSVRAVRIARLILHVFLATLSAALVFPFLSIARRRPRVRGFAQGLLHILAVRLKLGGKPPDPGHAPAMLVANHVSWLDIFAIDA